MHLDECYKKNCGSRRLKNKNKSGLVSITKGKESVLSPEIKQHSDQGKRSFCD